MLIPGIVSATFKEKSAEDVIALCLKAGLKAIEWSENWHIAEGDVEEAARIASLTAMNGLSVAAFGSYYRLGEHMDFSSRILCAKALGADVIRIWGGGKPSSELTDCERASLVEEARSISSMAENDGLTIALEWHKNTVTDTNESGLNFLKEVSMSNFKTLWQPTQALSIPERIEGLEALQEYLVNLHVYYWDDSGRRPLSEGAEIWREYLDCVSGEHYALLEFVKDNTVEQFLSDAKTLHELIDRS